MHVSRDCALRAYQSDLVRRVIEAIGAGKSPLMQLPTGGGKTVVAAEIIHRLASPTFTVWFVCHRREILDQAANALAARGVEFGIVASGRESQPDAAVQVCSVAVLPGRSAAMHPPSLIIWDECHHVASPSWSKIHDNYKNALHMGMTATPERLDGLGLAEWYDELIRGPSSRELIDGGFLSDFRVFAPTIPDLRGVKKQAGDFQKKDLSSRMDRPTLVGDVVEHYQKIIPDARAVLFAVNVEASRHLAERFCSAGIPAQHVDAKTPQKEREQAVAALASGEVRVLCNVELFTEGFDCPAIDAVILVRPTQSVALYLQMVGRGFRTYAGKGKTVILDHSGMVFSHGFPDVAVEWSLAGDVRRERSGGVRMRRCPKCKALHGWVDECPECGRQYIQSDRSCREEFGELEELHRGDGLERQFQFADRLGINRTNVCVWIQLGMPSTENGLVRSDLAEMWIKKNKPEFLVDNKEILSKKEFARRLGIQSKNIHRLVKRGMPVVSNNSVNFQEASTWIFCNWKGSSEKLTPGFAPPKKTHEQKIEARRNAERLRAWAQKGTPRSPEEGELTRVAFAALVGATRGTIGRWVCQGMPVSPDGKYVCRDKAIKWISSRKR